MDRFDEIKDKFKDLGVLAGDDCLVICENKRLATKK